MTTDEVAALLAEFRDKAMPLGVEVERCTSEIEAVDRLDAWMNNLGSEQIVVSGRLRVAAPRLISELDARGLQAISPESPNDVRDATVGASLAELAIAETGSTLLVERSLADRSVSMLTLSLAIICPTASLVASLDDAAPLLRRHALAPGGSYATLVTGPSRTADIERVLTVGVQGPGKVMVIFVDELGGVGRDVFDGS